MDRAQVEVLKHSLDRRRRQIFVTLQHLRVEQKEAEDNNDWMAHATAEARQRLLDRLSAWYVKEVGRIEQALGRIHSADYGLCRACGQTIEQYRLATFPEREFCLCCQDGSERM